MVWVFGWLFLNCMIRYLRPSKIVEVGSGYSSAVTLDTNELFFDKSIQCTFIEPEPKRFKKLLKDEDYVSSSNKCNFPL